MVSFKEIDIIDEKAYEKFDELHYKVENELISLIKSLKQKQKDDSWENQF